MMKWYIAQLIFRIEKCESHKDEFDIQWRMIEAKSQSEAIAKADELGADESCTFNGTNSATKAWKYIGTTQIFEFKNSLHGAEIVSATESPINADDFEESTLNLALMLKAGIKVEELL